MYRKGDFLFINLLCAIFLFPVSAAPSPCYSLRSVNDNELSINFNDDYPCSNDTTLFAFATQPGNSFSVVITISDDKNQIYPVPFRILPSGWAGRDFLQWISFSLYSKNNLRQKITGEIKVRYEFPVLQGIRSSDITFHNGICSIPFRKPLQKSAVLDKPSVPFTKGVRIWVDKDGIYEITPSALKSLGIPVGSINSKTYRLFEKNNEVPVYLTNPQHTTLQDGDRILFYGRYLRNEKGNYTQFSNTNVYWLSWGISNGARIAEASGNMKRSSSLFYTDTNQAFSAREFIDTIHFEQDNDIRWLGNIFDAPPEWVQESPGNDTLDNWYWGFVGGRIQLDTFKINVPSPALTGYARLRMALMGITTIDSISPDHHIQILVNQQRVCDMDSAVWDGQHKFIYQSDSFSAAKLHTGENTVFLLCPNRGYTDGVALNWIELSYLRGYKALDNKLLFKNSPNAIGKIVEYTLRGFTSDKLELWDIQRGRYLIDFSVTPGKGVDRGRYNLVFQDSISSPVKYFAQTVDNRLSPLKMTLDTIKEAIDSAAQADYIVISVDSFKTIFDTLRMAHEKKGLKTAFIDIDDIYNRFSYGIRDPECIRTFLKHLFTIAKNHFPRYLLLGGDTTHDLDKKNQNRNLVPTHLSRTPGWGPSADDGYFVTFWGDDNFADMCVGRLPGQNRAEMKNLIDKTVKYINSPDRGFWHDNLLLLGGGEKEFTDFNDEAVANAIGPKMNIIRMDANPASVYYKDDKSARVLIADQINAGCFMINFNGHGGGNIWSDNSFFGYHDTILLYNGKWGKGSRLPVVFSFTCLTGFFESASYSSLGEEFVRTNVNGGVNGAVAFYGASAYTSRNGNMAMNRLMLDEALSGSYTTLGDLIDFCEMNMLVRYGIQYIHLVRQYNLLGDPALPWILTPDTLRISLQKSAISKGDSLIIDGSCKPVSSGQVRIIAKSGDKIWNQTIDKVSSGNFKRVFAVKDSAATSSGIIRAYAWNDSSEVRGWCNFTKDTLMVQNVKLSISQPVFGDSVFVSCDLPIPDTSIQTTVYCTYAIAENNSVETSFSGVPMQRNSSGTWITIDKIPLSFSGNISERLILFFKVKSDLGTKQSEIFTYPIAGRPDLVFTKDGVALGWTNDSLCLSFQVLNMGNAAAPPFDITFFYGDGSSKADTMCKVFSKDSIFPGKIRSFTAMIPDTQGAIAFTGVINSRSSFTEILMDNNTFTGHSHIASLYMKKTTDTLFSNGKGLKITPLSQWSASHRVFLFDMLPSDSFPLKTRSSWVSLANDSVRSFRIFVRKPLENSDSLQLQFIPNNGTLDKNLQSGSRKAVMLFDSTILKWRSLGGETGNDSSHIIRTVHSGPFSLANITDNSAPDVLVSVHGRILNRLDYAAKDKPFNVSIADPSEILPSSVEFFLNGKKLSSDAYSGLPSSGDLSTMSITAYPKAQERIDSLEITAEDLAGNKVSKIFAYMPGANLSIQFFSCHPNPFSAKTDYNGEIRKTRFAFLLTDIASTAKLSIYTVSGKKIRSWNLADLLGYQEIEWDGRDDQGYRIANGTYYAKLTAENDNKKVKKLIRIAKLEGY